MHLLSHGQNVNVVFSVFFLAVPAKHSVSLQMRTQCKQVLSMEKVYHLLDPKDESNTSACLKGAWAIIQQTLQLYSVDELCISLNGGKDCTVLLHMLRAFTLVNKFSPPPPQLKALCIR